MAAPASVESDRRRIRLQGGSLRVLVLTTAIVYVALLHVAYANVASPQSTATSGSCTGL